MGRKITAHLGLLTVELSSDSAVEKPQEYKSLCHGQPGKPEHEHQPIIAPKQCLACGPIVDYSVLDKGVATSDGFRVLSIDDITEAKESYTREYKGNLNLVAHPAHEFLTATAPGDTLHYLTPQSAEHADRYQLLVQIVSRHPELVFASLHTPVSATALYRLDVRNGVLVMEKRTRQDSLKAAPSVGGTAPEKLLAQLEGMLAMFVESYDAAGYEDRYAAAIEALIESADTVIGPVKTEAKPKHRLNDADLLAQLQALAG